MISQAVADGIRTGRISMQYRRWDAPRVKVGGTQLTPAGLVEFVSVTRVPDVEALTDRQARAAGMPDAAALRRALAPRERPPGPRGSRGGAHVYRVRVRWVGEDPRIALRERIPDEAEMAELVAAVDRLDARATGPWTRRILEWIRRHPRVVSTQLAANSAATCCP